ncbi:hypothetical protein BBJ28_00004851, partial [Nothophytophthora sp. Chile5]
THIKQTSVKQLGPLVQEDLKQARERSGLLAGGSSFGGPGQLSSGNVPQLRATLAEFETVMGRIVQIYGGGDGGKRKALACVMQHLHKYKFSIDDFLQAAEELNYVPVQATTATGSGYAGSTVLNSLQIRMRRRSSFS